MINININACVIHAFIFYILNKLVILRKDVVNIASKFTVDTEEALITVDKFYKPMVVKEEDAATLLITRLILLEPGTIQTHPDMGVGIVSKFRHSNEIDVAKLSTRIKDQIARYLPQFTLVNVQCELDNDKKAIKIYITSEQLHAVIPISTTDGKVLYSLGDMM